MNKDSDTYGTFKNYPEGYSASFNEYFSKEHPNGLRNGSPMILEVVKLSDGEKRPNIQYPSEIPRPHTNIRGYGVAITILFIIGEMVGGGIIAMPNVIARLSWAGVPVIITIGCMSAYTGVQLGWCWMILQERWPEIYLSHTQKPYPEIGYRAGGPWMRKFVTAFMNLSVFGIATVFLLITATNVSQLLRSWTGQSISSCYIVLIAAAILLPITYLGSPKDFWIVSIGAAGSTSIAVIIMIIGMILQYQTTDLSQNRYPWPPFQESILGLGTIMFAYCGQAAFPTIQHDMRQPKEFPKTIIGSYAAIFIYYVPVSILGYVVYGYDALAKADSVLPLLPKGWIQDVVTVMITAHVMFGFIIYANPINQNLESSFGIPSTFTWKRLVLRTATVIVIVFLAESVPSMSLLLDLIGGTFMAFITFVFPGAFYLMLRWNTTTAKSSVDTPIQKWEYLVNGVIISVGLFGNVTSIYAFVRAIVSGNALFKLPCYVNSGGGGV